MKIKIITGPMFAGKTTKLIEDINNDDILLENKLIFNYKYDKRYNVNANIHSHDNVMIKSIPIENCLEINKYIDDNIQGIYIDEIQFISSIQQWLNESKTILKNIKKITMSGLDYDMYGSNFNIQFCNLILNKYNRHEVINLTSKCSKCNNIAKYTILTENNENICNSNNILISKDIYQPVCLYHALKVPYLNHFSRFKKKIVNKI